MQSMNRQTLTGKRGWPGRRWLLACLVIAAAGFAAPAAAQAKTADLSVTQTASADPVRAGLEFSYTVSVSNAGPDSVNSVTLVDELPHRVDLLAVSTSQGFCRSQSRLRCLLGPLAPGAGATVSIQVRVKVQKTFLNVVHVDSKADDPDGRNNVSRLRSNVVPAEPVPCGGATATIVGTDGPDNIVGTDGRDVIAALGGDDTVTALDGDDTVCGSGGDDVVKGNAGADDIRGGGGKDRLSAGTGNDIVYGKGGDDVLHGGQGKDELRGDGGRNKCFGDGGRTIKFSCS